MWPYPDSFAVLLPVAALLLFLFVLPTARTLRARPSDGRNVPTVFYLGLRAGVDVVVPLARAAIDLPRRLASDAILVGGLGVWQNKIA